jgi:Flp pilus assembly protein TadG
MRTMFNRNLLLAFAGYRKGNLSVFLALSMLGMTFAAGGAIDYLVAIQARTSEQAVIDATALAVARAEGKSTAERIKMGTDFLAANGVSGLSTAGTPTITVGSSTI